MSSVSFGSVCWNRGNSGAAASKPSDSQTDGVLCTRHPCGFRLTALMRQGRCAGSHGWQQMGPNPQQIPGRSRRVVCLQCAPASALSGDDSGRAVGQTTGGSFDGHLPRLRTKQGERRIWRCVSFSVREIARAWRSGKILQAHRANQAMSEARRTLRWQNGSDCCAFALRHLARWTSPRHQ